MRKIYILSGLGVDKRVFNNFDFVDMDVEFIDWISPQKKETLSNYTKRIASNIQSELPILIGLSFGGIVAIEIAKIIKVKQIILIASAKNKFELPLYYRLVGKLQLNKLVPTSILKTHNSITNWFFGANTKEDKDLLKNIINDTNPIFLKWAINQIVNWKNSTISKDIVHIHGNKDRIIPIRNIQADYIISGGGHFMTVDRASEIENILLMVIKSS